MVESKENQDALNNLDNKTLFKSKSGFEIHDGDICTLQEAIDENEDLIKKITKYQEDNQGLQESLESAYNEISKLRIELNNYKPKSPKEETKEQRAFRFLLDDYYRTPKHWEDYITIKEAIDDFCRIKKEYEKVYDWANTFKHSLEIESKERAIYKDALKELLEEGNSILRTDEDKLLTNPKEIEKYLIDKYLLKHELDKLHDYN